MSVIDDLKATMKAWRADRKTSGRGQALFDLNRWLGEERRKLNEEYAAKRAEIEALDDRPQDTLPEAALELVWKAVTEGISRSSIRVALGKQTLDETDDVIQAARDRYATEVGYVLTPTGATHARGWPFYDVKLNDTGEEFKGLYLTTTGDEVKSHHMKIHPSPPGSTEILARIWSYGIGEAMFARGKEI